MKAGRELDILVAEKVMGWFWENEILVSPIGDEKRQRVGVYINGIPHLLPKYSTDMADAWKVLERMQDRYQRGLMPTSFGTWVCRGYLPETAKIQVQAEAPLAICLSALKAVGWEGDEE
ncbi:hypothetical protein AM501_27405 [Aneurinibacillus migulanus]|uniref:BC1872 family protein n=1 Tax=Aneurinibacillus migulanus TaxID=47500 RepID=UPI0005B88CCD|nr:hypothetical protein [Aneurinibacillus migulanus]KIV56933.1 hypothetical protein TS64_07770 [Aneurinibacillus migulanus]KPD05287.1 hypothetical protein AM501_27405 [Aneurinibacillus migulanus]CEH28850.1 Uncharacterized protein BN1090_A2_01274 [Aneurinibacillus migulanus]